MTFNTDPNKQAKEITFTGKYLIFNNTKVSQNTTQKHLGFILDNKTSFEEYLTANKSKQK